MGLDMYLSKRTHVKNWDFMNEDEKHEVIVKKNGKIREDIKPERISEVEEDIAYWRKANAIHQWFVDNIQGGIDDCKEYTLDKEDLQNLLNTCKKVKESLEKSKKETKEVIVGYSSEGEMKENISVYLDTSLAETFLPTQSGFFFGSTDFDESYMKELDYTIEILTEVLNETNNNVDYVYRSSW